MSTKSRVVHDADGYEVVEHFTGYEFLLWLGIEKEKARLMLAHWKPC